MALGMGVIKNEIKPRLQLEYMETIHITLSSGVA